MHTTHTTHTRTRTLSCLYDVHLMLDWVLCSQEIKDTVDSADEVESVGTFVSITDSRVLDNGRCHLFVQGHYPSVTHMKLFRSGS